MSHVPLSKRERRELPYSPDAIAVALHSRRVAEGLSQAELGERLRVGDGTIRNWELGGMPVVAARILSYVFGDDGHDELYRIRALNAEAAVFKVTEATAEYRAAVKRELEERRNGHER